MAIMIREEFDNDNGLQVNWNYKNPSKINQIKESYTTDNPIAPDSIMTDTEAIHAGVTRNFTDYTEEAIISSESTWTYPYLRPVIMHHKESDGKIIGRVHVATHKDKNTLSGTTALMLTCNISDKEGKEAILDGRLKTVSIGAIVHEAYCSICGQNIAEEGPCEHERGEIYDGKVCTWRITRMEAKELSYVIVPSDIYAQHVKVYKPDKQKIANFKESFEGVKTLENQENKIVDETVTTGVQTPVTSNTKELEDKIKELKDEIEKLTDANKTLNKSLEDEKVLRDNVEKKLSDTQVLLQKANEDIEKVKTDLAAKESALQKEIQLREAAESQLIVDKQAKRNALVESVIELRTKLGKRVIAKEDLEKKSDEYLQESLQDLQEESKDLEENVQESLENKTQVTNPGIVENVEEKKHTDVKEQKTSSNMNVEEAMEDLISNMFKPKRY